MSESARTNCAIGLKWTTDTPTVPGWYWVRGVPYIAAPEPAYVSDCGTARLARWEDCEELDSPYFAAAEWCGPLEAPK